jgi:hypothetical protein
MTHKFVSKSKLWHQFKISNLYFNRYKSIESVLVDTKLVTPQGDVWVFDNIELLDMAEVLKNGMNELVYKISFKPENENYEVICSIELLSLVKELGFESCGLDSKEKCITITMKENFNIN